MTPMKIKDPRQSLALALILLGVLFRALPHPDNFTPTTALVLFAGVTLGGWLAYAVPFAIMAVSDLWIGFHPLFWIIWPAFALIAWAGQKLRGKEGALSLFFASLGASVFFFAVSNLGVFLFEGMYPKTWAGLVECFVMALPFFRNSLASDLLYTGFAFGIYGWVSRRSISKEQAGRVF
jgi:hypothetical protein